MRVDGLTPILNVTNVKASLAWFAAPLDGHIFRVGCETG
jgi:hypothetical protein